MVEPNDMIKHLTAALKDLLTVEDVKGRRSEQRSRMKV
jgi:hypothetical protein